MQQKSNTPNLVLFLILSALILAGSAYYQSWRQKRIQSPADVRAWADLYVRAPASAFTPGVPGIGSAVQLLTDVKVADWLGQQRYRIPPTLAAKREAEPPPPQPPKPQAVVVRTHEEPELGDESFNLKIKLTSRGGGVLRVVLNQFRGADANGLPEERQLELVPERINRDSPSNLLLHYENPDDDRPVDSLGNLDWYVEKKQKRVEPDQHDEVVFAADVPGQNLRIIKTYTLRPADYHVGLKVEIQRHGPSQGPLKFRYQVASGHGLPIEGEWSTTTYRNALVGSLGKGKNFWRDFQDSRTIAHKAGGDAVHKGDNERIQYAGIVVQYFGSVVAVTDKIVAEDPAERPEKQNFLARARPTVESELDPKKPYLDDIMMRVVTEPFDVLAKEPVVHKYLLYYGPVKVRLLGDVSSNGRPVPQELVNRYIDQLHLNTLTDYQAPGAMGTFFSAIYWTNLLIFFTNLMHGVLGWLHSLIPNYGVCIILLTLLVRSLMHPVSRKQARTSMKMQAIVPEIKKLQEKYKNDRQALAMAQMELYRKQGVSPMGSCWIVFLQMPIFLGLYYALQESIHFRLAPFLWVKNLAAPDMLFRWGESIPWISRPEDQGGLLYLGPYFNLLPIVAVAFMIIQQKFLMPPPTDEQQEMQQKMMKYMMVFFGLMFYKVAAGLCIYFIVSSAWGLAERKLLPKAKPATPGAAPASGGGPGKPAAGRSRPRGTKDGQTNGTIKKVQDMWAELLKQAKKK